MKRERLIKDEVLRSLGGTMANRYSRLQARQEAVEKINRMFGTNIEVGIKEELEDMGNMDENVSRETFESEVE